MPAAKLIVLEGGKNKNEFRNLNVKSYNKNFSGKFYLQSARYKIQYDGNSTLFIGRRDNLLKIAYQSTYDPEIIEMARKMVENDLPSSSIVKQAVRLGCSTAICFDIFDNRINLAMTRSVFLKYIQDADNVMQMDAEKKLWTEHCEITTQFQNLFECEVSSFYFLIRIIANR